MVYLVKPGPGGGGGGGGGACEKKAPPKIQRKAPVVRKVSAPAPPVRRSRRRSRRSRSRRSRSRR